MQASFEHLYTLAAPHAAAARTLASFTRDLIGVDKTITAKRHANFLAIAKIVEAMLRRICLLLVAHIQISAPKRKRSENSFPEGLTLNSPTGYRIQLLELSDPQSPAPSANAEVHGLKHGTPKQTAIDPMLPTTPLLLYLYDLEIALINPVKTAKKLKRKLAAHRLTIDSALLSTAKFKRLNHGLLFPEDARSLADLNTAARKALPLKYYPLVPYQNSS